jgi:hypothetical protein
MVLDKPAQTDGTFVFLIDQTFNGWSRKAIHIICNFLQLPRGMLVFGYLFLSLEANVYTPNRFPQSSLHARVAVRLDSKPSTFLGVRDRRVSMCSGSHIHFPSIEKVAAKRRKD